MDNKYVIAAAAEGNRNKWKYLSGSACGCHDNLALLDFVEWIFCTWEINPIWGESQLYHLHSSTSKHIYGQNNFAFVLFLFFFAQTVNVFHWLQCQQNSSFRSKHEHETSGRTCSFYFMVFASSCVQHFLLREATHFSSIGTDIFKWGRRLRPACFKSWNVLHF